MIRLRSGSLYDLLFCLALVNATDFSLSVHCWLLSHFELLCYCNVMNPILWLFVSPVAGFLRFQLRYFGTMLHTTVVRQAFRPTV